MSEANVYAGYVAPEGSGKRHIDPDVCVCCGTCTGTCPVQAIKEHDEFYWVDEEAYLACGACEGVCPAGAISAR